MQDLNLKYDFDEYLKQLSSEPELVRPFPILDEHEHTAYFRLLCSAGIKLEGISESARGSLQSPVFRSLSHDAGPGMVAVLGYPRALSLLNWCVLHTPGLSEVKLSKGHNDEPIVGLVHRGLQESALDLICIALSPRNQKYRNRLNWRVWGGLLVHFADNPAVVERVNSSFQSMSSPPQGLAVAPYGAVYPLWRKMLMLAA